MKVRFTCSPEEAQEALAPSLSLDPPSAERLSSALVVAAKRSVSGRYWWAEEGGRVLAAVGQVGTAAAELVVIDKVGIDPLAAATGQADPPLGDLRGCRDHLELYGEVATSDGTQNALLHSPRTGFEITEINRRPRPHGRHRLATEEDVDLTVAWMSVFDRETGTAPDEIFNRRLATQYVRTGHLHLWEDEGANPVTSTAVYDATPGISRLVFVYTPKAYRGRGFADALLVEVASSLLASGSRCILYADSESTSANRLYDRVGFQPFAHLATLSVP